ncbi:TPA: hypothetical protein NK048_005094 [Vibrio parahaemolyticus]|nr:hypothetical protein [Vibrio parahaemolyticus]HCH5920536.1 hypothetical protein [Vibrio parahaemolyticus]
MRKQSTSLPFVLILLVLLVVTPRLTVADDNALTDNGIATVQALPADVLSVSSGGPWFHENKEGWLRFLVLGGGIDVQISQLYIQWFEQSPDEIDPRLLVTKSVTELNLVQDAPGFTGYYFFESPQCLQRAHCNIAVLEAFDVRSRETQQFQLDLSGAPGEYQITKADGDKSQ